MSRADCVTWKPLRALTAPHFNLQNTKASRVRRSSYSSHRMDLSNSSGGCRIFKVIHDDVKYFVREVAGVSVWLRRHDGWVLGSAILQAGKRSDMSIDALLEQELGFQSVQLQHYERAGAITGVWFVFPFDTLCVSLSVMLDD